MKFWDASAVIPLCIEETHTGIVRNILKKDGAIVVWWGTYVECHSAFARLYREGFLDDKGDEQVWRVLSTLSDTWSEIEPGDDIKDIAVRILRTYPLRAADSLQLAAAVIWADKKPRGHDFISFDLKLRDSAKREGFTLLPARIL